MAHNWPRYCAWLLLFSLALALSAKFAYYTVFTRFLPHDDEGFILISLKSFFNGKPLYDQIYSCYQPWFYEFNFLVFRMTGLELCHNSMRLVTIALWLAASILNCAATVRLTLSGFLGLLVLVATLRWFDAFANEPGHPQALAYGLLSGLVMWFSCSERMSSRAFVFGAGALLGMLILTKINIGVFALLPAAFVLALDGESKLATASRVGLAGLLLVSPIVLLRSQFVPEAWSPAHLLIAGLAGLAISWLIRRRRPDWNIALTFLFVTILTFLLIGTDAGFTGWVPMLSIVSALLLLTALRCPENRFGRGEWIAGVTGMTLSVCLICGFLLRHGTTLEGLLNGLLVLPAKQSTVFHLPWRAPWLAPWLAFSGLAMAGGYLLLHMRWSGERRFLWIGVGAKLLFGVAALDWFIGGAMIAPARTLPDFWMLPFAWALIIPPTDGANVLGRRALLALTVMQPLIAFPIAGSQLAPAMALAIVVAAVCFSDGVRFLSSQAPAFSRLCRYRSAAGLAGTLPFLLCFHLEAARLSERYARLTPLNLPGATHLRLAPAEAARYQALGSMLARPEVGSFLTMPGMNSLYFWAKKNPPTDLNVTTWMTLIDARGQEAIWDAARKCPGLLTVRNRDLTKVWMQGRSTEGLPLARAIEENFTTVTNVGGYEVMAWRQPPRLSTL